MEVEDLQLLARVSQDIRQLCDFQLVKRELLEVIKNTVVVLRLFADKIDSDVNHGGAVDGCVKFGL